MAYNGTNQYLVVWGDNRNANVDIFGQLVNTTGTLSGGNFVISDAANNQMTPSIAYNGTNQYLVVWHDNRSGTNWDIYGQLVNTSGLLDPGGNFPISNDVSNQLEPSVVYNSSTNQYLVVWQDVRNSNDDIYGQLVDVGGLLSGGNFPISTDPDDQRVPSIAYNSSTNQYLVVWHDYRSGINRDIYGQYLTDTGALTAGNFVIVDAPNYLDSPHVVGNTIVGNYLVAYSDNDVPRDYSWVIVGQRQQAAIPTVSQWGMIIFMVLAGLGAVYYMRRQRSVKN